MWVECVDKCTRKSMIGWTSLALRAITESGQQLKTRVVWFKLERQSSAARAAAAVVPPARTSPARSAAAAAPGSSDDARCRACALGMPAKRALS
jgi:hypothetical protein